jgi:hypothetical protein
MQIDRVDQLFKSGEINQFQFEAYCTFMGDTISQNFFKNRVDALIMEEVPALGEYACSYYVGRVSIWREIKEVIYGVNHLLEGRNYDGSSRNTE